MRQQSFKMEINLHASDIALSLPDGYHLRAMQRRDIPAAYDLSQQLGWPHRLEDWQFVYSLSRALVICQQGRVIATASLIPQGEYATIALVIVTASQRGKGLGRVLMQALMQMAGDKTLLLSASDAGVPLYQKLGFVAGRTIRQYQGIVTASTSVDPAITMQSYQQRDAAQLTDFINAAYGVDRSAITKALSQAVATQQSEIRLLKSQETITACVVVRTFGRGVSIGPVIARDKITAHKLIVASLQTKQGQFVRIDFYDDAALAAYLQTRGLTLADSTTQMVLGRAPVYGTYQPYAILMQATT